MNIYSIITVIYIKLHLPRSIYIALQFRLYVEFLYINRLVVYWAKNTNSADPCN